MPRAVFNDSYLLFPSASLINVSSDEIRKPQENPSTPAQSVMPIECMNAVRMTGLNERQRCRFRNGRWVSPSICTIRISKEQSQGI